MIVNTDSPDFYRVEISRRRMERILQEVISQMIEFRDRYGYSEESAITAAVSEHLAGLDTCADMQESGGWRADLTEALFIRFKTKSCDCLACE